MALHIKDEYKHCVEREKRNQKHSSMMNILFSSGYSATDIAELTGKSESYVRWLLGYKS